MNEEQIKILSLKIGRINLGDGDYLVIKFPENTDTATLDKSADLIIRNFPELAHRIILCGGDIKIFVVHDEKNK